MPQFPVVDDDGAVRHALAAGLEVFCGASVVRASSGLIATQVLQTQLVDLAVIEAFLPDISGYELAERAADCNVPVLLIGAHPTEQEACKVLGYPHLDKPFSLNVLADVARRILRDTRENIVRVHLAYARLMGTSARTERTVDESRKIRIESRRIRAESVAAREARMNRGLRRLYEGRGETSIERVVILENMERFHRMLEKYGSERLNGETARTVARLLAEEEAKLGQLDEDQRALR
jgi:DNA-binding response OmpR family regulator